MMVDALAQQKNGFALPTGHIEAQISYASHFKIAAQAV